MYGRTMKRSILILLLVLCGWASAQRQQQEVRDELVKTDRIIAEVKPIVEQSHSKEARFLFDLAVARQKEAWQAFQKQALILARDLTDRARKRANDARLVASINPERVREEVKKTRDLANEWGALILAPNNPRANELWKMAQTEQAAAEDHLARERYGYALKFTLAARQHGKEALHAIGGRARDLERLKRELDRTDAVIEKATARLKPVSNQRATDILNKAVELQKQARQALADGRPWQALKLTLSARELLLRAWESSRPRLTPELVEQALADNDAMIAEWADDIRAQGDTPAAALLDQAIQHQEAGRRCFEQKLLRPAFSEADQARKLLKRAVEMVQTEAAPGERP
jgi:hypothetical protein